MQPTAYAHFKFKIKHLCNCLSDSDHLSGGQYNKNMSTDYQYATRREESSFESAFTSNNEPVHSPESLTDPFMANSDVLMLHDEDSVTSSSTQGNTNTRKGNRVPAGSFYEMDEEELAQQMDSKYSISHRKGSSFSNFMEGYSINSLGGMRPNTSFNGLSGLNTVNISHISSISNNIIIATSPDGGVSMPAAGTSSSNVNTIRGRTVSGQVVSTRIKSDSSQDGINF